MSKSVSTPTKKRCQCPVPDRSGRVGAFCKRCNAGISSTREGEQEARAAWLEAQKER